MCRERKHTSRGKERFIRESKFGIALCELTCTNGISSFATCAYVIMQKIKLNGFNVITLSKGAFDKCNECCIIDLSSKFINHISPCDILFTLMCDEVINDKSYREVDGQVYRLVK